jgi:hypothetical protein
MDERLRCRQGQWKTDALSERQFRADGNQREDQCGRHRTLTP